MKSYLRLLTLIVAARAALSLSYPIECNDNWKKDEADNQSFELNNHRGSYTKSLPMQIIHTCHNDTRATKCMNIPLIKLPTTQYGRYAVN